MLDSFEDVAPHYRLVMLRGKPKVTAETRDGIAANGSRSLNVQMGVPDTNGYHEAGLVWSFNPPLDLSGFEGVTLRYRVHDDDYHSFFIIISEPGGVLYHLNIEPRPAMAGQRQTLTVPNRYVWYHEGAQDPNGKPDLTKITSLRFRLYDGIKKPFSFDLDGLGFVRHRDVYAGPKLTVYPNDYNAVHTNGAPFAVTARCSDNTLAAVRPMEPLDAGPNANSIFGVWVGGNPGEVGAKWTRQYVWGNQRKQEQANQPLGKIGPPSGISSILHFTYIPKWLSSRPEANDYGKYPPTDWAAYGRFLEWVMQSTKAGGYHLYEIWNEPNPHAYWNGTVDEVVKLAEVTYKAVKHVDPDARVLGPCPFSFTFDFFDDFFSKGGNRWIDDVVVHTYTPAPPDDYFLPGLQDLRRMMGRYGLSDRGIYITEMGYSTPEVNERDMAAYLVRTYVYALSEGVRVLVWHMLQALDAGGDPGYALKFKDGTPRPAYVAYATMTRVLERAAFSGPAPGLANGQRGFDFEKRGRLIRVLWDKALPCGQSSTYLTALPAGRVRVVDLMGAETTAVPESDGRFRFRLGADAIYVIAERDGTASAGAPGGNAL